MLMVKRGNIQREVASVIGEEESGERHPEIRGHYSV